MVARLSRPPISSYSYSYQRSAAEAGAFMAGLENELLTRTCLELGEPDAHYHIQPGRFYAKLTLGLGLVGLGVFLNYFWWVHGPGRIGHLELLLLVIPPFMGGMLLWHVYRHRGLHVLIFPTGLLRLIRHEVDSFPWREITTIHLTVQRAAEPHWERDDFGTLRSCWLPVHAPLFRIWESAITLTRSDGVRLRLTPVISHYNQLAQDIQQRTFDLLWPSHWSLLHQGLSLDFDGLEIGPRGLRADKKFLRWSQLAGAVISQGKISIKQKGKWLPWWVKDLEGLPNPHVLVALLEEGRRHLGGSLSATPPTDQPAPEASPVQPRDDAW